MRILHATHDFLPRHRAGAEIYAYQLCAELKRRSHDVRVLCADYDPSRLHGSLRRRRHDGLQVLELTNNWTFSTFRGTYQSRLLGQRLGRLLDQQRPDVLHLHTLLTLSQDLPLLARRRGIPCVVTLHDYSLVCPAGGQLLAHGGAGGLCHALEPARCARCFSRSALGTQMALGNATRDPGRLRQMGRLGRLLGRQLPGAMEPLAQLLRWARGPRVTSEQIARRLRHMRRVADAVDLFLAPSRAMARFFAGQGIPRERLRVSDYGLRPLPRGDRGVATRPLRLGFVGTLAFHKGAHLLLGALRHLSGKDYELKIHGDPRTSPDYAARLRQQAYGMPVDFEGPFDPRQAGQIYQDLDLLVVPSLWPENSPLVIHEAFSAGVPVLGSRAGGITELVRPGQGGLLFEPGDTGDLSRTLRDLVQHPQKLQRLVQTIPAVKTVAQNARELEAIYHRLANASDTPKTKPPGDRRKIRSEPRAPDSALRAPPAQLRAARCAVRAPISVLLVTHDGMRSLPEVVERLRQQRLDGLELQLVAVDSGSRDGTAAFLEPRVDRLIRAPAESFNHGLTRNLGLQHCDGELVVLLVQDAIPATRSTLARLIAPLLDDPRLAGSHGRQLPRREAGPLTRGYAEHGFAAGDSPRLAVLQHPRELASLSPWQQYRLCAFDNVCSCVRRSVWQQFPFEEVPFAEDLSWARRVLTAGHRLVYVPEARVLHSHERSAGYELRRTYLAHQRLRALFGLRTVPTPAHLAAAMAGTMGSHLRFLIRHRHSGAVADMPRAVSLAVALPLGQYLGALSADTGRALLHTDGV